MNREEVLQQLKDLKEHCNQFVDEDDIWQKDVEALEIAIEVLKREQGVE